MFYDTEQKYCCMNEFKPKLDCFKKLKVSNNPETQDSYHISEVRLGPN